LIIGKGGDKDGYLFFSGVSGEGFFQLLLTLIPEEQEQMITKEAIMIRYCFMFGYWMLDAGCWLLDAGYWMLVTS
jgi:hypothetical protein